jgi:hypothetical protein
VCCRLGSSTQEGQHAGQEQPSQRYCPAGFGFVMPPGSPY